MSLLGHLQSPILSVAPPEGQDVDVDVDELGESAFPLTRCSTFFGPWPRRFQECVCGAAHDAAGGEQGAHHHPELKLR